MQNKIKQNLKLDFGFGVRFLPEMKSCDVIDLLLSVVVVIVIVTWYMSSSQDEDLSQPINNNSTSLATINTNFNNTHSNLNNLHTNNNSNANTINTNSGLRFFVLKLGGLFGSDSHIILEVKPETRTV